MSKLGTERLDLMADFALIHSELDHIALEHLRIYLRLRGSDRFGIDATTLGYKVVSDNQIAKPSVESDVHWGGYYLNRPKFSAPSLRLTITATPIEFGILETLVRERGNVCDREQLGGLDTSRNIDIHVRRLREKLGPDHAGLLQTVRGFGYRLLPSDPGIKPS